MPRGVVALLAAALAAAAATTLHAAGADPLLGAWRVTAGGSGTVVVQGQSNLYKLVAGGGGLRLGCIDASAGDTVGFVELPSRTRLPAGQYDANFGYPGQGCSYSTKLVLHGNRANATVSFSENDVAGGPFAFARIGAAPKTTAFRWTAATKAATGSGSGVALGNGKVISARGSVAISAGAYRWSATVDPPGQVRRGGQFSVTLTLNVTEGNCVDKVGQLVLTKGHAVVRGLCGVGEVGANGTTALR